MPKEVVINNGKLIRMKTKESIIEVHVKKCQNQKNVIEPNEILDSYGIDATRIFMISDSPPDRELEVDGRGHTKSKNLIHRTRKIFHRKKKDLLIMRWKKVEKF